jgi:hypothetical protein
MMGKRRGNSSPGGIHLLFRPGARVAVNAYRCYIILPKEGDRTMPAKKKAPAKKAKKTSKKK